MAVLKKYERWPFAMIEKGGRVWLRSKTKGWFQYLEWGDKKSGKGYLERSRYINHPDFIGCKQIMRKKDLSNLSSTK